MTRDPRLRIQSCTSLRELAGVAPELDRLNLASRRPSPFSTFAFLSAHVEHDELPFDDERASVLALLAYQGQRLVGFLPLRRRRQLALGRPFTRVEWMVTRDSDGPQLVADPGLEAECADVFVKWLRADRTWSVLVLGEQDERSPLRTALRALPRWGYTVAEHRDRPTATVAVRWTSFDAYYRALNQKMRSNTSRLGRRLFAAGEVSYVTSHDPRVLEALLAVYLDVEARSWKVGTQAAVGTHPHRVAFLRRCLTGGAGMRPSMGIVTLSGLPIAAIVQGRFGDQVHALKMAYDESFATVAPGRFLMLLAVGDAVRTGAREFNLLSGLDYFKGRFGADVIEKRSLQVLRVGRRPFHQAVLAKVGRLGRPGDRPAEPLDHNPSKRRAVSTATEGAAVVQVDAASRRLQEITEGVGRVHCETHDELARRLPFLVGR